MSTTNAELADGDLILTPDFMAAKTFEDLKELMSLYCCEIVVNSKSTNRAWLERISSLERRGLIEVEHEKLDSAIPYTVKLL